MDRILIEPDDLVTMKQDGAVVIVDTRSPADFKNIAAYFGSWNEWARDPVLPIEEGFPSY